jgi:hypothetical protein
MIRGIGNYLDRRHWSQRVGYDQYVKGVLLGKHANCRNNRQIVAKNRMVMSECA